MSFRRLTPRVLMVACVCVMGCAGLVSQAWGAVLPATVEGVSALNVASQSATFSALIDPRGSNTTYRFEYGKGSSYEASVPVPDGDAGSGSSPVSVLAHVQGLAANTVYHYRIVASSAGGSVTGLDLSFTTQSAPGLFALPDGRVWEMVSPPNKQGALIEPLYIGTVQAAADGSGIAYVTGNGPLDSEPALSGESNEPASNVEQLKQILSVRQADGWFTRDIAVRHTGPDAFGNSDYRLFSSDLTVGLIEPAEQGATPLSANATERTLYLREPDGSFEPLVDPEDVPANTQWGTGAGNELVFRGASPDLAHVVFSSPAKLTSNAVKNGLASSLYEWSASAPAKERLKLVSVLPDGKSANSLEESYPTLGDSSSRVVRNAVSADGGRVVWSYRGGSFLRDLTAGQTIRLDSAQGVAEPPGGAHSVFQGASSDGSRIFFIDDQKLTVDSTATMGAWDLYVYDAENGELTDLSVDHNSKQSGKVQGMMLGASEDGSYAYFVATGALAPGAIPGADNLYLVHDGEAGWDAPVLVATLSPEDSHSWAVMETSVEHGPSVQPELLTSRVSPDGRFLAFMSDASLTGYDNHDSASGALDEEVFLYQAKSHRLVCASCDPTGARPHGVFDAGENTLAIPATESLLVDRTSIWARRWLAGNIPAWTFGSHGSYAYYQSRYLDDQGRLFFTSSDALVPQDTNGVEDVYEYEPGGIGRCERLSGCVGLISSGSSSSESAFLDASASGDDVFFITVESLVTGDRDSSFDLYDAHECTAAAQCVAVAPVPPPCVTESSCRAAPSPQPTIFGEPSSATFSGTGNVVPSPAPVVKAKTKPVKVGKKHIKRRPKRAVRARHRVRVKGGRS